MKQEGQWGKFTDALKKLRNHTVLAPSGIPKDKEHTDCLKAEETQAADFLERAQRFYIPNPLEAIVREKDALLHRHIHMPFSEVALLVSVVNDTGETDWLLILVNQKPGDINLRVQYLQMIPQFGDWGYTPVYLQVDYNHEGGGYASDILYKVFSRDKCKEFKEEFDYVVAVIYAFSTVLEACNVKHTNAPVPIKLQKKRIKSGKQKLLDYHVLSIGGEVWDSPHEHTGTGEGKRSHLRRGHIRRLEAKSVWVRSTYVHGSKEGFVRKDYEVKGTSNAVQEPQGS